MTTACHGTDARPFPHPAVLRAARRSLRLSVTVLAGLLSACAVVHVDAGDGRVRIERHLGLVVVAPDAGQRQALVLRSIALGWQGGVAGQSLGYSSTRLVMLPEGCRVAVVVAQGVAPTAEEFAALAARGLCPVIEDAFEGER